MLFLLWNSGWWWLGNTISCRLRLWKKFIMVIINTSCNYSIIACYRQWSANVTRRITFKFEILHEGKHFLIFCYVKYPPFIHEWSLHSQKRICCKLWICWLVAAWQQVATNLSVVNFISFAYLLQLVETSCNKSVNNKFCITTCNRLVNKLSQAVHVHPIRSVSDVEIFMCRSLGKRTKLFALAYFH